MFVYRLRKQREYDHILMSYIKAKVTHNMVIIHVDSADVSESIECSNDCHAHSVECVSNIKSILSIVFVQYMGVRVCIKLTRFSNDDCENTCTLSYYHQIGSMTHLSFFMIMSWHDGMRCMSSYILRGYICIWTPTAHPGCIYILTQ